MTTITTTPYETQEEAVEGRVRSMGYSVAHVMQLATNLAAVRATVAEMEASGFPQEYGILEPVKQLEVSATLQVEPKITSFLESYQELLTSLTSPTLEPAPA